MYKRRNHTICDLCAHIADCTRQKSHQLNMHQLLDSIILNNRSNINVYFRHKFTDSSVNRRQPANEKAKWHQNCGFEEVNSFFFGQKRAIKRKNRKTAAIESRSARFEWTVLLSSIELNQTKTTRNISNTFQLFEASNEITHDLK